MKMTTCKVTDERYIKACKILDSWRFVYEVLPSGNLRAEPMDFSIIEKIISQLQRKDYFVLTNMRERFLIIKPVDESTTFVCQ